MISAEEFVGMLEEKDLLPPDLVAGLRQKISQAKIPSAAPPWNKPITAARLAKWLVDNGHLSRLLAQRMLVKAEASGKMPLKSPGKPPATPAKSKPEVDLGFAPSEGEPATPAQNTPSPTPIARPTGPTLADELPIAGPVDPFDSEPFDSLMGGSMLDDEVAAAALEQPARGKKKLFGGHRKRRVGENENVWDSKLLLVGGGSLLLLIVLGGALIWAFMRRNADDMLQAADECYGQGSYTNAILNYDRYIKEFPKHTGVSLAKVRRGLAQLRQATEGTSNWPRALEVAQQVLKDISSEEKFPEGRPELSSLLPKIAEQLAEASREKVKSTGEIREHLNSILADQAQATEEEAPELAKQAEGLAKQVEGLAAEAPILVQQAKTALALVTKYIPDSELQRTTRVKDINALLALTEWEIGRDEELVKATDSMVKLVEEGKTADAYDVRNELLRKYPRLIDDQILIEAVVKVSQAEQKAVAKVDQKQQAVKAEPDSAVSATVTLANRTGDKQAPGAAGHVLCVGAEAAVYGLEADTGQVVWRRQVGFDNNGRSVPFPPTPVTGDPGSDILLIDARSNEVVRVQSSTGLLGSSGWRHPLGERFDAHPVVADDQVLVATRSGRLVSIDLESGNSTGYVQLPHSLAVAPAVDARRSSIYQVAEHSNLFVISQADGTATQVVYLGHEPGSIITPPVIVNRFLVIAENDELNDSKLRVLTLEADGDGPRVKQIQEMRLRGHVDTAPVVSGIRILVVTDRGDVYALEISATNIEAPLMEIAKGQATGEEQPSDDESAKGLLRFPLILPSGQVWIADSQLTRYDIQVSRLRLEPKGIENKGSVSLVPPVPIGRSVFHIRRKTGLPGVLVSAFDMNGGRALWETQLAAPLVSEPVVGADGSEITAVTTVGGVFQVASSDVAGNPVIDRPVASLTASEARQPVSDLVPIEAELLALASTHGAKQIPVFDNNKGKKRFNWIELPDVLDCPPIAFGGGLVAPCGSGQVLLLDPRSGAAIREPFQPKLESGRQVDWRSLATTGPNEFLLADGRNNLYRIGVKDQPKPHLDLLGEIDLSEALVSPMAVIGKVMYAVDASNTLVAVQLPKLDRGQSWDLSGRCVWGPMAVGDRVLMATDDDQLYCLDSNQVLVCKVKLPYGRLAGAPLPADDGEYILASAGGVVWRVKADSGAELAKIETGYPLATGPVRLGDKLLVGGSDGCLHTVDLTNAKKP